MPRFAAIDVGSNAIRLRVVDAQAPTPSREERARVAAQTGVRESPSPFKEVTSSRAAVRLGAEVFISGRLTPQSIQLACAAFRDFRNVMDSVKVDATRAIATSAVREADNGATRHWIYGVRLSHAPPDTMPRAVVVAPERLMLWIR